MEIRTQKLHSALGWMQLLLTLLLLWGAEALGGFGVSILLPAALILLLPFSHYAWFGFVTVVSWYAPVRTALLRLKSMRAQSLWALLLCNVGAGIGFAILFLLGANPLSALDPFWLALLITGIELLFLLFEVVFWLFRKLYQARLRRFLLV